MVRLTPGRPTPPSERKFPVLVDPGFTGELISAPGTVFTEKRHGKT